MTDKTIPEHIKRAIFDERFRGEAEHVAEFNRLVNEQELTYHDDKTAGLIDDMDFELIEKALRLVPKLVGVLERIAAHDHVTGFGPQLDHLFNTWIDQSRAAVDEALKEVGDA